MHAPRWMTLPHCPIESRVHSAIGTSSYAFSFGAGITGIIRNGTTPILYVLVGGSTEGTCCETKEDTMSNERSATFMAERAMQPPLASGDTLRLDGAGIVSRS
jgi:hypothetical protein